MFLMKAIQDVPYEKGQKTSLVAFIMMNVKGDPIRLKWMR